MTTAPEKSAAEGAAEAELTEMTWDPITRIVGSLGIYTKIDFKAKRVAECHSTSSIFRGYSIFMQGKDPRDAPFITSRICGDAMVLMLFLPCAPWPLCASSGACRCPRT